MKSYANNRIDMSAFLCACILYVLIPPYFFWHGDVASIYVKCVLGGILAVCFFVNKISMGAKDILLFLLLLASLVVFTLTGGYNVNLFISLLPCVFLPFGRNEYMKKVYNSFLNIYVIIIAISLISWFLMLLGLMPSFGTIGPLNTAKTHDYIVYPLLVAASDHHTIRFFGPFDEPGVVGTLSGILLCIEKINLKNRKSVVLLLSGLCALSFFFFLLIGIYFLLDYSMRQKKASNAVRMLVVVIGIFLVINQIPVLYENIGARFEWDSSKGQFAGDDRINKDIVEEYIERNVGTSEFWWGVDDKEGFWEDIYGASSFLILVILNGLVFSIMYIVFYVLYGLRYKENWWSYILFLFVFIGTLYQRPEVFTSLFVFLFTFLIRSENLIKIYKNNGS